MARTKGAKNSAKGPSTKRLAVAQRYTKRLKALQDKGIDITYFDKLTKSIPGVKRTKKGISIDAAIYEKNKEAIISSLDIAIPSYKKYKELEGIVIKTKKLEKTLNKRAQDVCQCDRVELLADGWLERHSAVRRAGRAGRADRIGPVVS